jgi:pyrrolidone-carboxylate peptidase
MERPDPVDARVVDEHVEPAVLLIGRSPGRGRVRVQRTMTNRTERRPDRLPEPSVADSRAR